MIKMNETVFAYVRVSTDIQEKAATEENQKEIIKSYCDKNSIKILETFRDVETGTNYQRINFTEMMKRLGEVDGIIMYDLSRISRDFIDSLKIVIQLKDMSKKIYIASENRMINYNDDMDQLITLIKSWFSSYERKKIIERSKLGIQRFIKEKGRWGPKKKELDVKMYQKMRKSGISISACARFFGMSRPTLYKRLAEKGDTF